MEGAGTSRRAPLFVHIYIPLQENNGHAPTTHSLFNFTVLKHQVLRERIETMHRTFEELLPCRHTVQALHTVEGILRSRGKRVSQVLQYAFRALEVDLEREILYSLVGALHEYTNYTRSEYKVLLSAEKLRIGKSSQGKIRNIKAI